MPASPVFVLTTAPGPTGPTGPTGATGPQGAPGIGYNPRGAYASGTTYAQGDEVADGGINYISLQSSNTGHTPASSSTWWQALGASGLADPGANGIIKRTAFNVTAVATSGSDYLPNPITINVDAGAHDITNITRLGLIKAYGTTESAITILANTASVTVSSIQWQHYTASQSGAIKVNANTAVTFATSMSFEVNTGAGALEVLRLGSLGLVTLLLSGVSVYANNAAAIAGGLAAGALYRTGANPDPICIVH